MKQIDWQRVQKELKRLKIPKEVYNPLDYHDMSIAKWYIDISERSTGKTTNWLLVAIIVYYLYGYDIAYVRKATRMVTRTNASKLFETILSCDYISKITKGKFNSIKTVYREHFLYNNETDEIDDTPFMTSIALEEYENYKSNLNMPQCNIIIFDEFLSNHDSSLEYIYLQQTIKTIIRSRFEPIIICCGNTIDKHNIYFKELCIYSQIQTLKPNKTEIYTTDKGTTLSVRWVDLNLSDNKEIAKMRQKHNSLFFGFNNPKLSSVTGGAWDCGNYPRCPRYEELGYYYQYEEVRFIYHNNYYLKLVLFYSDKVGLFVKVEPSNEPRCDEIVYTMGNIYKSNYIYQWGKGEFDKLLEELRRENRFYFATNTEGAIFENYIFTRERKDLYE